MFYRVPAAPLRRVLLGWQASHGDDVATIARGFDLPVGLVEKLLGPNPARTLAAEEARVCCVGMRAHPVEIWPARAADRLGPVTWETEILWVDAGVDPVMVTRPARMGGAWKPIR